MPAIKRPPTSYRSSPTLRRPALGSGSAGSGPTPRSWRAARSTRHDHRVWRERKARIMVLGNRHPVEPKLIGAAELVEGDLHRSHGRFARIIFARERPDVVRRLPDVARGAEKGCFHINLLVS